MRDWGCDLAVNYVGKNFDTHFVYAKKDIFYGVLI